MKPHPVEPHVSLDRWEDFDDWLSSLRATRAHCRDSANGLYVSDLLFRGQADSGWRLSTTLERMYPDCRDVVSYFARAYAAKHSIEAHTGRRWSIETPSVYSDSLVHRMRSSPLGSPSSLEYLAYLRHHGFPSPLLDWSSSPYIAAFFAFSTATRQTERVAIFAFLEHTGEGKGGWSTDPDITSIGNYITADRRHHAQRSQYTFCTQMVEEQLTYVEHDQVLTTGQRDQDLLWKVSLPATDREKALRHLDQYNLNAYSLFGSEEALMTTLAFRELPDQD